MFTTVTQPLASLANTTEMMIMMMEVPSPRQPRRSSRRSRWSRRGTRRVLRSKLSQLGIGNIFIFIHPTHYFLSLFSSFIQLGFEISFTLFQKLFPSIVRLHKWEICAEDSSKLRFQIATFLRFSCLNLQLSLGRKRFRRGQLHENMHHHQPQNFCPTFLL